MEICFYIGGEKWNFNRIFQEGGFFQKGTFPKAHRQHLGVEEI